MLVWVAVTEFPLQNWNRCDLSKLLMKFAHVIDVAKATLDRMDLEAANVLIGCETLAVVPEEIQAVIGHRSIA